MSYYRIGPENQSVSKTETTARLEALTYFWKGSDIIAAETKTLTPADTTLLKAILKREENLPPIKFEWQDLEVLLPLLSISDRSRLAQLGMVTVLIRHPWGQLKMANSDEVIPVEMSIKVYGGRPIQIEAGQGVACLYYCPEKTMLVGKDLVGAINQGVKIDGDFAKDWFFIDRDFQLLKEEDINQAIGIGLKLREKRFWIPPGTELVHPFQAENYRDFLDQNVLEPIPSGQHRNFWLTETTAALHLDQDFNATVNLGVKIGDSYALHARSPLLQGGRTNWPIRTELVVPENPIPLDYKNMYILLHLFQDR